MADYLIEILAELRDNASSKIHDLQRAVEELKAQAASESVTGNLRQGLADTANEAERAADAHRDVIKEQQESSRISRQNEGDVRRAAQRHQEAADTVTRHAATHDTLSQSVGTSSEEIGNLSKRLAGANDELRRVESGETALQGATDRSTRSFIQAQQRLSQLNQEYERYNAEIRKSASAADQAVARGAQGIFASRFSALARQLPAQSREFDTAMRQSLAARAASQPSRDFVQEGNVYIGKLRQLDQAAKSHTATNSELTAGYSKVASGLRRVTSELDMGSAEAKRFGEAMDDAVKKAGNINLARSSGIGRIAQDFAAATDSIGIKIVSLSAQLRGLRLAGFVGLFQPIITGLLSLAGGFFNVASGAGQAAASIGGAFLSGIGQMIPVLSIGIAALIRLRDVFQAVQAAQAARQQSYFQPFQGLITHLQNANQLIQAEQNLTNAYYTLQDAQVQVKESQMALTQARIDAIRNLQDLVMAEKSARLQLAESNLSVTQAEQALARARTTGSAEGIQQAQLALRSAQLQHQQAQLGVPRAEQDLARAQRFGIAGAPNVLSAVEARRQATLGVTRAQQGIGNAERQMRITQLQLRQPASQMSQQQATLQYLLSQMSAPEKALFNVLNNLEMQLRSPNSPLKKITDYIIQPFVVAGRRLTALLKDPSFMAPVTDLARAMGRAMMQVENAIFGQRGTSFFETMARDATKSLPIITRGIVGLMHVFQDLATAAAPAFRQLSEDWARFWNALDARDRTPQGQARLTAFFNKGARWAEDFGKLAVAVYDLFRALGHDAAPQGMDTVRGFTEAIHDATTWIEQHGPEVTNFFMQARKGLAAMGGVLFNIGKMLVQVFSLTSLLQFTQLLNQIVIPAVRILGNIMGFVVTQFIKFLNAIGPLKEIIIGLTSAFFGLLVLNRVIGMITKATDVLHGFIDAFKAFRGAEGILNRIGAAWGAFTGRINEGTKAMQGAKTANEELTASQVKGKTAAEEDAAMQAKLDTSETVGAGTGTADAAAQTEVNAAEVGGVGAGTSAAEGGLLARLGGAGGIAGTAAKGLGFGALLYTGYKAVMGQNILGRSDSPGTATSGDLASLLGKVGASHYSFNVGDIANSFNPFGSHFLNDKVISQPAAITSQLKSLQDGLKGVTNAAQLSTPQLHTLWMKANDLLQMPDITATQRRGLSKLVDLLNPANLAMQKAGAQWEATFQGINATTGNVMQQVQQVLSTDISNISANLGTGTNKGAVALSATIQGAFKTVVSNANLGAKGVQEGLQKIDVMLNNALKQVGAKGLSSGLMKDLGPVSTLQWLHFAATGSTGGQGGGVGNRNALAAGGWHPARPGGQSIVAEEGYDEVVLTTDPRHAERQRMLLAQYLRRSPRVIQSRSMAAGGLVDPIPGFTLSRTDQGVDAGAPVGTPIRSIADSKLSYVIQGWYAGQPLIEFQITDGPYAGRYWYVAEQVTPVTERVGAKFKAGQTVGHFAPSGTNIEIGWGASLAASGGHGTLAAATTGYKEGQVTPAGSSFLAAAIHGRHAAIPGGPGAGGITVPTLQTPKYSGPGGVWERIGQSALSLYTKAANRFLRKQAPVGATGAAGTVGNVSISGGVTPQTFAASVMRALNIRPSPQAISDFVAWETQEGGNWNNAARFNPLNTTEGMPGSTNPGFAAGVQAYTSWAQGVEATAKTLAMSSYAGIRSALARGAPLGAFKAAVDSSPWGTVFASGGLLGKHLRRLASGGKAPWGGMPVPIIAHEGERISNPDQWGEIARMAGTTPSALDHHLGYDNRPRQSFAPGGIATLQPGQGRTTFPTIKSFSDIVSFLGNIGTNLYKLDPGSVFGSFSVLSRLLQEITKAFSDVNKLPIKSQLDKLGKVIENFADPQNQDSTLNLLAASFQRFQDNINAWITSVGLRSRNVSRVTSIARVGRHGGFRGSGFGGVSFAGGPLTRTSIGDTGQAELDALNVRASVEQTQYLQRESQAVARAIRGVRSRMRAIQHSNLSRKTKDSSLTKLQSAYTLLVQQQETLNNAINQQINSTFEDEQQHVQDVLSQVSDVYQTQQQQIQTRQSLAQAQGRFGALPQLDQALIDSAKNQIKALQQPLHEARRMHNADLVAQIQQQISQLNEEIGQTVTQIIQDRLSEIQQTFETQQAKLASRQTIAQTLGRFQDLPAIDLQVAKSAQDQIKALQRVLVAARRSGNQGAVAQIEQQIAQLRGTVVQSTAQMISDAMSAVQQYGQTTGARVSELQAIAQVQMQGAATPGQFAQAGATNLQALNTNQSSLQTQLSLYKSLLTTAIRTGNQGQVSNLTQEIDQLTAQLVQNTSAIQDNTAQLVSAEAQFTQSRGQFQTGTIGTLTQIIQTIGQTTGFTNVPFLQQLFGASNRSLQTTNTSLLGQLGQLGGGATGLANMLRGITDPAQFAMMLQSINFGHLEAGHDQTWINTFESLVSSLVQNTSAVAQNNQQLATLNGQLLQPQSWSTTVWSAFRSAVFSGMGNLLPQFQTILPPGAVPTIAPIFSSPTSRTTSPTIGTLNIHHVPTTSVSPQVLGEQLAFEASNAL